MSLAMHESANEAPTSPRQITIEFLYLDLETCDRCIGTDINLDVALAQLAQLLEAADLHVTMRKTQVTSEHQARELRFMSSPTLRVNDRDIALELRESTCGAEACACNGNIDCRVWVWHGQEYTAAPSAMIVDAVLREVYHGSGHLAAEPAKQGDVPENLRRFFASTSNQQPANEVTACCAPTEQATCCEPAAKASCCDDAPAGSCGCQ